MHGRDRGPVEILFWYLPEMPWEDQKNSHDRRSSGLYFISGLSDCEARSSDKASYWIQTIINIAEEDKSIVNSCKTLL